MAADTRRDLYAEITNSIIAALEAGTRPWVRSWTTDADITRPLRANGVAYRGINVINLWISGAARGYASPFWLTFRQAIELGGHVRKGEKSTLVVYASTFTKKDETGSGETNERQIPFLKSYSVFNAAQIEGLPAHYYPQPTATDDTSGKIEHVERFFSNTGAAIENIGNQPLYSHDRDIVLCPPISTFDSPLSYYVTLAHELTHWTGAKHRLDRISDRRHDTYGRAFEELIAELGAAFICADLGMITTAREENASYIASWLTALKNDKRFIFSAATKAQQAADYLQSLQPQDETGEAGDDFEEGAAA